MYSSKTWGRASWLGEFGISAPFHRPPMATSRKLAAGVLEYSLFQESSACQPRPHPDRDQTRRRQDNGVATALHAGTSGNR